MLSYTFDQCGVYYFSDISGNECASYIGIVAVKKKPEQHVINYKEEAKRFEQGKNYCFFFIYLSKNSHLS